MQPARPPVPATLFARRFRGSLRRAFGFRRVPQPPAGKPSHLHVGARPAKLVECRQQLLAIAGAKRRWFVIDEDGPVREAGWHKLEALQFFDQRRAFEIQQLRGLPFVPAGAGKRQVDQLSLDLRDEQVEIEAFFGQRDRRRHRRVV